MGAGAGKPKESKLGPEHEGTVEGIDPNKKLGTLARDYYFRAGLQAFMEMMNELREYNPGADESHKATMEDFASTVKTAAATLEKLTIAADEAKIRAGDTQIDRTKQIADLKAKGADAAGDFAKDHPDLTNNVLTTLNIASGVLDGIFKLGGTVAMAAMAWTAIQRWLGKGAGAGEAALGAAPNAGASAVEATTATAAKIAEQGSALESALGAAIGQMLQMGGLLGAIAAISDAFDEHRTNTPGFKEKTHADEAEEDKRKREGNGWNAVMLPDAANATRDFIDKVKGWFSGSGAGAAAGAEIGRFIADAAQKGASNADLGPAAQAMMAKYAGAIPAAEGPAIAAVDSFVAKLKAMLNFTAGPTIQPRLIAPSAAPGGSGGATPRKQSRAGGGNIVVIKEAHFHGVQDPKKLHEQVMARANRDAASAHVASLHDIDTGGVG